MVESGVLDVAIGLALTFLLLSLAVSRLNEMVTSALSSRHRGLRKALDALLGAAEEPADTPAGVRLSGASVLEHPIVTAIHTASSSSFGQRLRSALHLPQRGLSYLPARTFSAVVLDLLSPARRADAPPDAVHPDPLTEVKATLGNLPENSPARKAMTRMVVDANGDLDRFRTSLEHWYDDTMDRVTGWYKRYVQRIIVALSVALVLALNVDTVNIAHVLWRQPTERAAVAAAASNASLGATPEQAVSRIESIGALDLPIGWSSAHRGSAENADPTSVPLGVGAWLLKLVGMLISVLALALGAPFWFDALGRLVQLRQSGPKPASN